MDIDLWWFVIMCGVVILPGSSTQDHLEGISWVAPAAQNTLSTSFYLYPVIWYLYKTNSCIAVLPARQLAFCIVSSSPSSFYSSSCFFFSQYLFLVFKSGGAFPGWDAFTPCFGMLVNFMCFHSAQCTSSQHTVRRSSQSWLPAGPRMSMLMGARPSADFWPQASSPGDWLMPVLCLVSTLMLYPVVSHGIPWYSWVRLAARGTSLIKGSVTGFLLLALFLQDHYQQSAHYSRRGATSLYWGAGVSNQGD